MPTDKITVQWIRETKQKGRRIAALTAYDYPTARLLDEAGIDILLVGDSVGMAMLGFPDTTHVTMEHIVHHTAAVARAKPRALVVADLPYHSYTSPIDAVTNGRRLMEVGAEAVKLEGGLEMETAITALLQAGIPVMGHLGMLPQSIKEEGGVYRIKGKTAEQRGHLQQSMRMFVRLGVFSVVLELVQAELAELLTKEFGIPTIGIGSGQACDGQVLVTPDLIGLSPWFRPKFVIPAADVASEIKRAVGEFKQRIL
jgi:3-methyl-2-oxobutanoate hydroxymethyltransferase